MELSPMETRTAALPSSILGKPSLYVGDLHPEVTELDLIQAFGYVAPLISVRVCRDRNSLKSRCYGYVNYFHLSDASRALACLNHTELKGKTMRIMWCQRNPLARKNSLANLYVKNLVPSVTSAQLEGIFCKFGVILSCKVSEDDSGKSRGFGFVQFASEDSAMAALEALNGTMLEGKQLYVCKFMKKSDRNGTSEETFRNLYVKNLDEHISEDILREKFSEHGKVCSILIVKDNEGKSKGFGFVEFSSHEEAKNAVERLNGALLGSKNLFVGKAQKKVEREESLKHECETMHHTNSEQSRASKLHVKNLSLLIDDRKLEKLFIPYGRVTSAKVMHHNNGVSKGFGFVCFSTPEEAKRALESLNGTNVEDRSLYVSFAVSPERSRQFQRWQAPKAAQSFFASNSVVLYPGYQPIYYSTPQPPLPISLSHLSLFRPNQYPNFGSLVSAMSTYGVENPQFVPNLAKHEVQLQLPHKPSLQKLDATKDVFCQHHKPFKVFGKGSIGSTADVRCRKSDSLLGPFRSLPKVISYKKGGKIFSPRPEIIEPKAAAKTTRVLLKTGKSDLQQVMNSPHAFSQQVEQAVQLMEEATAGLFSDEKKPSEVSSRGPA